MNTWVVARHPIGHFKAMLPEPVQKKISANPLVSTSRDFEQQEYGEKVFFMKSRIFAGQLDLSKNELGDQEFQWLTKEELKNKVAPPYWTSIRNLLNTR